MVFDDPPHFVGPLPVREPMPSETISLRLFKLFLVSEDVFESQDFYLA